MFSTVEKQDVNIFNSILIERWIERCLPRGCLYVWLCVGLESNKIEFYLKNKMKYQIIKHPIKFQKYSWLVKT